MEDTPGREVDPEEKWEDGPDFDSYEIRRSGDIVLFVLSCLDGHTQVLAFTPGDAVQIGMEFAQAGQDPPEESQ